MAGDCLTLLIVEDNPGDIRLVREMLAEDSASPYTLTPVSTVRDAIDVLASSPRKIDAVLLDLSLPDETGLETVRRVVAASGGASVVVMTGAGDEALGLSALSVGAQDYLVKGQVDGRALRRALRYAVGRQQKQTELESRSLTDDLTGLNNRRGFLMLAEQQIKVARRLRQGFLLLFLDLDDLKAINDTRGHAEGNRALVEAAAVLRGCFRQSDILARLGGDEFAAFAINSTDTNEPAVRGRLAEALGRVNDEPDRQYALDFSVGMISVSTAEDVSMERLLERADALMYEEKRKKRRS